MENPAFDVAALLAPPDILKSKCALCIQPHCCFSKRMRKLFRKNEKSVLRFCNKSSKTKRAFTKVLMPCKRPF